MLENTLENKAKFLLHCYAEDKNSIKSIQGDGVVFGILDILNNPEHYYSELKPLSSITDEDAIEVAKLGWRNENYHTVSQGSTLVRSIINEHSIVSPPLCIAVYQYLQSKAYALPFMGLSVEELVSRNWIKIKS